MSAITALAFTAAVDDPDRFRRSHDLGAYFGLVPRRFQSDEVDYSGSISKCGDRRVRTLLYEAANVMLTRYRGALKLKGWALAIARRSTMRQGADRTPGGWASSCMRCCGTGPCSRPHNGGRRRQETETSSRAERRPREGVDDGAEAVGRAVSSGCIRMLNHDVIDL